MNLQTSDFFNTINSEPINGCISSKLITRKLETFLIYTNRGCHFFVNIIMSFDMHHILDDDARLR